MLQTSMAVTSFVLFRLTEPANRYPSGRIFVGDEFHHPRELAKVIILIYSVSERRETKAKGTEDEQDFHTSTTGFDVFTRKR